MPITRVHTSTHITVTCHNYHSRLHTLISHTLIIHTHRTLSSNTLIILIHNTQYSLYTLFIHTHHTNSSCTLCTSLSHLPHTQHNHTCPPNSRTLITHTSPSPSSLSSSPSPPHSQVDSLPSLAAQPMQLYDPERASYRARKGVVVGPLGEEYHV